MNRSQIKTYLYCVLAGLAFLFVSCTANDKIQRITPTKLISEVTFTTTLSPTRIGSSSVNFTPSLKVIPTLTFTPSPTLKIQPTMKLTPTQSTTPVITAKSTSFFVQKPLSYPPVVYPNFTSFTNSNYIRTMLIDRNGDLWTGGSGGVVHWNTKNGEYVKYTTENGLASNFITAIAQTVDGVLWFGTRGAGISRFDGTKWDTYTTKNGLPDNYILGMVVVGDTLWVQVYLGIDGDIIHVNNQTVRISSDLGKSTMIVESPNGVIWRGGYGSGLERFNGNEWQSFSDNLKDQHVTALDFAPDGTLWVGTETSIYKYDEHEWIEYIPWGTQLSGNDVNPEVVTIAATPDGSVWFGFSFHIQGDVEVDREEPLFPGQFKREKIKGVYCFRQGKWSIISTQDGLVDNEIRAIAVAPDGKIWYGSYDRGVSSFDGQIWNTFQTNDRIISNIVNTIAVSNEGIWLSHSSGISHFDGNEWISYIQIGQLNESQANAIYIDRDQEVWFGTMNGIAKYDGQTWITYKKDKFYWLDSIDEIITSSNGMHIFGGIGASEFDGSNWNVIEKLKNIDIKVIIAQPNGTLWFVGKEGMLGQRVYSFDGHVWTDFTNNSELKKVTITSGVATSDGTIWFLSCHGITSYNGIKWITVSPPDVLGTGCLNGGFLVTEKGIIWIGTENGLLHYDGQVWELKQYNGLPDNVIYDIALGGDGAIWIGTHAGLSRYMPPTEP